MTHPLVVDYARIAGDNDSVIEDGMEGSKSGKDTDRMTGGGIKSAYHHCQCQTAHHSNALSYQLK